MFAHSGLHNTRRILVIRRDNIGDLVCTTPCFAVLRRHYPNVEIGALVNSYNAEVLRGNPNVDHVFVYQKFKHAGSLLNRLKALRQRLKLIVRLRLWSPDVTILAKSSYDRHGVTFARLIGAKNIIGYIPEDLSQAKGLPDIRLKTPDSASIHEVESVNGLLEPLGICDELGPLQVFPDIEVAKTIDQGIPKAPRRIALHISAREDARRWGLDNFVELAKRMLQEHAQTQILLFWSPGKANDPRHPGDDAAAAQVIAAVGNDRLIPMPMRNITQLIAGLSLCELFIGTDGGAMHLAVALNKRIVALFENRSSKLNHWYPWQVKSQVLHSVDASKPNIDQICFNQVLDAVAAQGLQVGQPDEGAV